MKHFVHPDSNNSSCELQRGMVLGLIVATLALEGNMDPFLHLLQTIFPIPSCLTHLLTWKSATLSRSVSHLFHLSWKAGGMGSSQLYVILHSSCNISLVGSMKGARNPNESQYTTANREPYPQAVCLCLSPAHTRFWILALLGFFVALLGCC